MKGAAAASGNRGRKCWNGESESDARTHDGDAMPISTEGIHGSYGTRLPTQACSSWRIRAAHFAEAHAVSGTDGVRAPVVAQPNDPPAWERRVRRSAAGPTDDHVVAHPHDRDLLWVADQVGMDRLRAAEHTGEGLPLCSREPARRRSLRYSCGRKAACGNGGGREEAGQHSRPHGSGRSSLATDCDHQAASDRDPGLPAAGAQGVPASSNSATTTDRRLISGSPYEPPVRIVCARCSNGHQLPRSRRRAVPPIAAAPTRRPPPAVPPRASRCGCGSLTRPSPPSGHCSRARRAGRNRPASFPARCASASVRRWGR